MAVLAFFFHFNSFHFNFFFFLSLCFASSFALPGRLCRSMRSFGPFFSLALVGPFLRTVPLLNGLSVGEGPAKACAGTLGRVLPAGGGPRTKTPKKTFAKNRPPGDRFSNFVFGVFSVAEKTKVFYLPWGAHWAVRRAALADGFRARASFSPPLRASAGPASAVFSCLSALSGLCPPSLRLSTLSGVL